MIADGAEFAPAVAAEKAAQFVPTVGDASPVAAAAVGAGCTVAEHTPLGQPVAAAELLAAAGTPAVAGVVHLRPVGARRKRVVDQAVARRLRVAVVGLARCLWAVAAPRAHLGSFASRDHRDFGQHPAFVRFSGRPILHLLIGHLLRLWRVAVKAFSTVF